MLLKTFKTKDTTHFYGTLKVLKRNKIEIKSPLLTFEQTTLAELKWHINQIKPKNACGIDAISPKLIGFCADEIKYSLTDIVNKSLA